MRSSSEPSDNDKLLMDEGFAQMLISISQEVLPSSTFQLVANNLDSQQQKNVMMGNSYDKMTSSIWHWHFGVSFPSAIKSGLCFPQLLHSYFVVTCLHLISDSNSDSSPSLTISPVVTDNPGE